MAAADDKIKPEAVREIVAQLSRESMELSKRGGTLGLESMRLSKEAIEKFKQAESAFQSLRLLRWVIRYNQGKKLFREAGRLLAESQRQIAEADRKCEEMKRQIDLLDTNDEPKNFNS